MNLKFLMLGIGCVLFVIVCVVVMSLCIMSARHKREGE